MSSVQKFESILVVNVNWLGDVIFAIPVFKALRKQYPQARISCLAVGRVKDILQCIPQIDDIIVYDEKKRDRGIFRKLALIQSLRRKKFDAVFLLHGSWSRALIMFLAGIPVRVGYETKKGKRFLTHTVKSLCEDTHKADCYLNVVESFGVLGSDRTSELSVPQSAKDDIAKILFGVGIQVGERFVVVHTSGNWDLKRWPQENWSQLIRILVRDFKIKVVISEGPSELDWANAIAMQSQVNPIVLAGQTNLQQLMALLERATLVISADSGPLHIASCVSQNIIGIYGPTMPSTTGPRGKAKVNIFHKDVGCNRASCYYLACPDNVCMKAVKIADVVDCIKELI
ncbi:MAG: lipopolysaccharide heptosyltransferase II [Candidatus Omnitrophica bacterium]|nr:lipopolysaccharide heptosyltransferase II [Candidatus Omnitrophota bacterium]